MKSLILAIVSAWLVSTPFAPAVAQEAIIHIRPKGAPAGRGFSGWAATPISATAVLQSWMDASDSGAVLGFALAIRGPAGWYNARTRFADIPTDSLPTGTIGQRWEVGERRYRIVYDRARMTLALFDTTVSLLGSRVVLVTLGADPTAKARVESGAPVELTMSQPTSFAALFLPRAPEVRAFAGLAQP